MGKLFSCCKPNKPQEQIVEVEKILKDKAWKYVDGPFKKLRYKLEVQWNYVDKNSNVAQCKPRPEAVPLAGTDNNTPNKRDRVLFTTDFSNYSGQDQKLAFRTERTTVSRSEFSIQKGFKIGGKLDLQVMLPIPGLNAEFNVQKQTNDVFEETLKWSIETQLDAPKDKKITATLIVEEHERKLDYTVLTLFRPKYQAIPVHVLDKRSGLLVEIIEIPTNRFAELFDGKGGFKRVSYEPGASPDNLICRSSNTNVDDVEMSHMVCEQVGKDEGTQATEVDRDDAIYCESEGMVRAVFGAKQVIKITTEAL